MLADYSPVPVLAVTDLDRARAFYEGTLGLTPDGDVPGGVRYRCGAGSVFVYPSAYAGTNKATAVAFEVPDEAFDTEVAALRGAGLEFITFDADGMEWQDGVGAGGGMRGVWFADPDGNILNLGTAS